jgi:hypothetical protein
MRLVRALLLACAVAAPHAAADEARERLIAEVAKAANGFLAALPEDRRLGARAAFQSRDRTTWRYTPGNRPGMPLQEMSPAQREAAQVLLRSFLSSEGYLKVQSIIALALVELYAATMKPKLAEERLARIRARGLDGVRFAWAGSTARGRPHYYRVQGPTFLIEFDNSGSNHVHSVWRDFEGDFGRDLLREHYGASAHVGGRHEPRR